MWLVDNELLIVIGHRRVDAGLLVGGKWVSNSLCKVNLPVSGDLNSLGHALGEVAGHLKTCLHSHAVKTETLPLRFLLADDWFGHASIPWNAQASTGKLLEEHARSSLFAAGVVLHAEDKVRVADASYREPRWATAYPAALLRVLEDFAEEIDAPMESIAPYAVAVIRAVRARLDKRGALVALIEEGKVSLWLRGRWGTQLLMRSMGTDLPDAQLATEVDLLWRRVRARDPRLTHFKKIHVVDLNGAVPADQFSAAHYVVVSIPDTSTGTVAGMPLAVAALSRTEVIALDVLQRRPRTHWRHWIAAGSAGILAAALLVQIAARLDSDVRAKEQIAAIINAERPTIAPVWSKDELRRVLAVNGAISQLNFPVARLLQVIVPPPDIRVAVLSVEFAPPQSADETPRLKVGGAARSGAEMTSYVAYLAAHETLTETRLLNHEVNTTDASQAYRFTLEAKWHD